MGIHQILEIDPDYCSISGPSTMFYYFECCSGECCIRIQPIPSFLLTALAIFLAFVCCLSCCCYCCCRN
ncbi:unnamed protein product [Haemonchus placei]|uniref:CX domain-containing protein n=1 Tax=Haemonchus placei TaxID=6290 RepID=A0A0N4WK58_HAEPC|nr:unnamed protein product [Haemonchus placei]